MSAFPPWHPVSRRCRMAKWQKTRARMNEQVERLRIRRMVREEVLRSTSKKDETNE